MTYPGAMLGGGVKVQLLRTRDALQALAPSVEVLLNAPERLPDCDAVHLLSLDPSLVPIARAAKQAGKRLIITPIFMFAFRRGIRQRTVRALSALPGMFTNVKAAQTLMGLADQVIAMLREEAVCLAQFFRYPLDRIEVIPNMGLAQSHITLPADDANYALYVGAVEPRKNLGFAIEQCRQIGRPLHVFGPINPQFPEYADECRRIGEGLAVFHGAVAPDSTALLEAYAQSSFLFLPSHLEAAPLVIREAAHAGRMTVVLDGLPCQDHYEPFLVRIREDADPRDWIGRVQIQSSDAIAALPTERMVAERHLRAYGVEVK